MNQETLIQRAIMLKLSEADCIVWRNNTAGAYVGKVLHKAGDQVTLGNAHLVQFGLCKGSADLIGITPVTITQDMVGSTVGAFTAIEVKTKTGRASPEQLQFIEAVRAAGGIAGLARSPADALELLPRP